MEVSLIELSTQYLYFFIYHPLNPQYQSRERADKDRKHRFFPPNYDRPPSSGLHSRLVENVLSRSRRPADCRNILVAAPAPGRVITWYIVTVLSSLSLS